MRSKKAIILSILIISLLFRLWLTDKGWHVDMWSNASWGEWIFSNGPGNFYTNSIWSYSWPTQPPLINSIYAQNKKLSVELLGRLAWTEYQLKKITGGRNIFWLSNFVRWYGFGKINPEIPFQIGFLATMKFWPILADLIIAIIIYELTDKKLTGMLAYLASPFAWALSSLWGQYDGVAAALLLLGFWGIGKKWEVLTPAIVMAAFLVKPTALILMPFWIYMWLKQAKDRWYLKTAGVLMGIGLFWLTTAPYTQKNPLVFARYDLIRIVFEKAEPRLSVNAFNFWRIFTGNRPVNANVRLLGIPASWWGILVFGLLNAGAFYLMEKRGRNFYFWDGIFLIGGGSFLFMTGMLERYLFAGMVGGLLAVIHRPRLYKYWVAWSVVFWINLYYHWWVPENFSWLKQLLLWQEDFITRVLSIANVGLFWAMAAEITDLPARLRPGSFRKLPARLFGKLLKQVYIWRQGAGTRT